MTVVCDDKRRVVLPGAKPGDRFDVRDAGTSKVLTLLKPVSARRVTEKLVRGGGELIFEVPGVDIEPESFAEAIQAAVHAERESR